MNKLYPVLIGIIVLLAYLAGINGNFQFDDHPNIIQNERLHISTLNIESLTRATLSGSSGILKRPVSMLSFAINYYFSGLNPFSYKVTNIIIHIANCIGIYWLCLLLFNSLKLNDYYISKSTLSFIIAIAWGVHPINLTAVLYVVQRMTSLGTLFTILAILLYLNARNKFKKDQLLIGLFYLVSVIFFWILGVLSKENSALLIIYLFVIELILYRQEQHTKIFKYNIFAFFALCLFIPLLSIALYTLNNSDWILKGYNVTSFTLYERTITELRIIWLYIYWILIPNNSNLGFFHDDIIVSKSLFDSTLPILSGIGHFILISTLFYFWKRQKQHIFVLGISIFYASHLVESTILPLMLAFEHRNYFGSFGILLAIFSIAFSSNNKYKNFTSASISIYILFITGLTAQRASTWGDGINNALINVQHHPNSAAAHYELGRQYAISNDILHNKKAEIHFQRASKIDTKRADALFAMLMLATKNKMPIREELINELRYRLELSPVYASHIAWMDTLINCHLNKVCSIKKEEIAVVIEAAINNKNLDRVPLSKSYYLMIASNLLANGGNNYEQARDLSIIAAKSSPSEVKFTINLINLSLAHNDYITANKWIAIMDDSYSNLYPNEIKSFKQRYEESFKQDNRTR